MVRRRLEENGSQEREKSEKRRGGDASLTLEKRKRHLVRGEKKTGVARRALKQEEKEKAGRE